MTPLNTPKSIEFADAETMAVRGALGLRAIALSLQRACRIEGVAEAFARRARNVATAEDSALLDRAARALPRPGNDPEIELYRARHRRHVRIAGEAQR